MFLIIFSQLKDLIQRVYQINIDKTYTAVKRQPEYLGSDDFNHIIVDPLSVLKIPQCNQSQYRTVWPTMLQPSYLGPFNDFSNFNCKKYLLHIMYYIYLKLIFNEVNF